MERKGEVEWMVREQRRREELKLQTVERREERERERRGKRKHLNLSFQELYMGTETMHWIGIILSARARSGS